MSTPRLEVDRTRIEGHYTHVYTVTGHQIEQVGPPQGEPITPDNTRLRITDRDGEPVSPRLHAALAAWYWSHVHVAGKEPQA